MMVGKRLKNFIRALAMMLALSMVLGTIPVNVVRADENETLGNVLGNFVRSNLTNAGASSDAANKVTDEMIQGYFRSAHPANTDWSATSLVTTIQSAANTAGVVWALDKGTDYGGQPISANYSMGDLVVAYIRANVAAAAALTD